MADRILRHGRQTSALASFAAIFVIAFACSSAPEPAAAPEPTATIAPAAEPAPAPTAVPAAAPLHWLNIDSGIRHRAGCRYHGKGDGRECEPDAGRACKVCGG